MRQKEQASLLASRLSASSTNQQLAPGLRRRQVKQIEIAVYDLGGGTFDVSILNSTTVSSKFCDQGNTRQAATTSIMR
jgi:hypothetical protein